MLATGNVSRFCGGGAIYEIINHEVHGGPRKTGLAEFVGEDLLLHVRLTYTSGWTCPSDVHVVVMVTIGKFNSRFIRS